MLQVLAKELGFVPCEWQPPVPTLWHEHRYQVPTAESDTCRIQCVSP